MAIIHRKTLSQLKRKDCEGNMNFTKYISVDQTIIYEDTFTLFALM